MGVGVRTSRCVAGMLGRGDGIIGGGWGVTGDWRLWAEKLRRYARGTVGIGPWNGIMDVANIDYRRKVYRLHLLLYRLRAVEGFNQRVQLRAKLVLRVSRP